MQCRIKNRMSVKVVLQFIVSLAEKQAVKAKKSIAKFWLEQRTHLLVFFLLVAYTCTLLVAVFLLKGNLSEQRNSVWWKQIHM